MHLIMRLQINGDFVLYLRRYITMPCHIGIDKFMPMTYWLYLYSQ